MQTSDCLFFFAGQIKSNGGIAFPAFILGARVFTNMYIYKCLGSKN